MLAAASERRFREQAQESRRRIATAGPVWHRVLGLMPNCTISELKSTFKELALMHHPDKGLDGDKSGETFKKVQKAYEEGLKNARPDSAATATKGGYPGVGGGSRP